MTDQVVSSIGYMVFEPATSQTLLRIFPTRDAAEQWIHPMDPANWQVAAVVPLSILDAAGGAQ